MNVIIVVNSLLKSLILYYYLDYNFNCQIIVTVGTGLSGAMKIFNMN
jgi:hypothetical protein